MKQRIFHIVFRLMIQTLLKILSLATTVAKGIGFCSKRVARGMYAVFALCVPAIVAIYCAGRHFKQRLGEAMRPIRGRAFYFLGHRYFIHGLVVALAMSVSIPSLLAAGTSGESGEQILLQEFAPYEEGEALVIDDTITGKEFDSYLEGTFQNEPRIHAQEGDEISLPLTLEGDAIFYREIPATLFPVTRTAMVQYEVEDGDTAWGIAEKFNISVSTVLWENGLHLTSTIRPSQKLSILPVSGVTHKIRKGETLEGIAKQYGASLDEVREINQLAVATIAPGIKLVIPGGRPYAAPGQARERQVRRREIVVPPSIAAIPGGKLLWPVISKRVTQYFKWRHAGLDVGDKAGNPIYAAENGVVEISGWGRGGWGNTVVIDHGNGLKTRYAHASKILVEPGQQVNKGQVIALVGSTGRSTGPHLHLSVYINGRVVNPLQYLR